MKKRNTILLIVGMAMATIAFIQEGIPQIQAWDEPNGTPSVQVEDEVHHATPSAQQEQPASASISLS